MGTEKQAYWFKRRRYGYGWTPVTKEGWGAVAAYFLVIFGAAFIIQDTKLGIALYLALVVAGAIGLMTLSYKKGPKPKWRWGKSKADNPEEDL
jgi:hypothetical protein